MPVSHGFEPRRLDRFVVMVLWVGLLALNLPAASAAGRNHFVRPEIGFGGGVQDSRTGAMSLVKLDLASGLERLGHRGSYGFLFRLDRFWLPQDIYRLHVGVLAYYNFSRPLVLRRVRIGVGPLVSRWERYHEPFGGFGAQAELSVGIQEFADWWVFTYYDHGEMTYSVCAMTGIRLSTSLFRLLKYDKRERWW